MGRSYGAYTLLILLLITSLIFGSFRGVSSSADQGVPASQGRPIAPAGSLVQDLTTRQVAVGGLPVDFVRSPDAFRPERGGRFLIAGNSGYGIQFIMAVVHQRRSNTIWRNRVNARTEQHHL